MKNIITIITIFLITMSVYSAEKTEWISFDKFVEANMNRTENQDTLIRLLKNPDPEQVEFGIRFSKNQWSKLNAIKVYEAIWTNNQNAFPSLNMKYLRQPVILLAITVATSKIKDNKDKEHYKYVISQINESNPKTLPFAIIALGFVGTQNDLKTLTLLSKEKNGEYLVSAALSILEIDNVAGVPLLKKLRNEFGVDSKQAKTIDQILKRYN